LLADKRSRFFNIEKHGSAFLYFFVSFCSFYLSCMVMIKWSTDEPVELAQVASVTVGDFVLTPVQE